jgi:hypothetical protein
MHLYRNDTPGQNEAPLIPTGLSFTQVSDNTALLSWDPGTDDHTPANALTYDLKLFRDNVPVTVPAHTPEPGNVSTVKEWLVTGLESGNYTWTLSTIDAAYIASQVATGEFGLFPVSVNDITGDPAGGYRLGQNYPNPFGHLTTIKYSIPREGTVSIKIYNMRGEEVTTLINRQKPAGSYEITFDAAGLPDGVYYYTLRSGDFSFSRKLVVSKGHCTD